MRIRATHIGKAAHADAHEVAWPSWSALAAGLLLAACGSSAPLEGENGGSAAAGSGGASSSGGISDVGAANAGASNANGGATAAPAASGLQVLHEGEDDPSLIALDDRFIYWTASDGLRQAPLAGGPPITLAPGDYVRAVVPSGEHVYFAQNSFGSGRIARVARAGGDVEQLADSPSARDLAIAGDFLYWVDPGSSTQTGQIFRAALDGTNVTLLAEGLEQPGDIALDAEFVYFSSSGESCSVGSEGASCTGGGIRRVPLEGGAPELVLSTGALGGFWLASNGLYWFASFPPRLMFAPPFGTERELANVLSEGVGPLSADADALYWPSEGKVLRLAFEGESVTRLVTNLEGASAVAVRDDWVYVAESAAGRILRVATDGSANRPAGPITGPCPEPIGSVEELALSPRPDTNLEQLALSLEPGNLTASQAVYDRVVADIAAIRALVPDRADIGYLAPDDGKTVYLGLSDVAAQSILAGEYSAWDCLNERYGASLGEPSEAFYGSSSVLLTLRGIYDISRVAERYAALPGVTGAGANAGIGDGPTVCAARDGERYQYVIDRAGGDCPSGCTEHDARAFASDAAGQVSALGAWVSESGEPAPAWFGICR